MHCGLVRVEVWLPAHRVDWFRALARREQEALQIAKAGGTLPGA